LTGPEAELYDETAQELRRAVGQDLYAAAFEQGRVMSLDNAVTYALSSMT
jgi:hypothetical protein